MKVVPSADYPVRVLRQEWEENSLYAGIFAVTSITLWTSPSFQT